MALPRTFVGFSSADKYRYDLMTAWKANENIPFDFADFQLNDAIDSTDEYYIKSRIRPKIVRSDTYALIIGADTFMKTTYVKWEVEVAIETGCRLIGVNLNANRFVHPLTPRFFLNKGALHVPYSPHILEQALKPWNRSPHPPDANWGDWSFYDSVYTGIGYTLNGTTATWPEKTILDYLMERART
jgi:hypothetical protein